jgi:hypothetical protein
MLELMRYLQRNGFRSYIVTGAARSSCGPSAWRPTASRPSV